MEVVATSLRLFLEECKSRNELVEVDDELSTMFEVAARLKKLDGGPVVLFKRCKESRIPVVGGVCSTRSRILHALGVNEQTFYGEVSNALTSPLKPMEVEDGPVKEIVEEPNLLKLPVLTHYEKDRGPYLTAGIVVAKSVSGNFQNASIHRILVLGKDVGVIRLVPRHLYSMYQEARSLKKPLEVAVVIGMHPAILFAAACSPPFGVDELWVANSILKGGLRVCSCTTSDVKVPVEAEIVLEGLILPDQFVEEGPFVDVTGTYDIVRRQPIIKFTRVMRRSTPIYQAILPASLEHRLLMGMPRELAIWNAVSSVVPKVKAVRLTPGGCGWLHAVVSIKKQVEGDGKNAIIAAFTAHPSLKHVVVVDEDVDVDDLTEVEWAIATRFQGDRGLVVIENARGSSLDPSADQDLLLTTKVGIDATIPIGRATSKFEKARIPGVEG
ncbi:MAG: UbiD family decarboxylase [Candidatus Nezhaarchaeales archaeon]